MSPRSTLLIVAVLVMGFAPAPLPRRERPYTAKGDLEKMQGAWVIAQRYLGEELRPWERAEVEFVGTRCHFRFSDVSNEWDIQLDTQATPRSIDFMSNTDRTWVLKGVYRFDRETLIVCAGVGPDTPRPKLVSLTGPTWSVILKRAKR
jgi:uncharacterized protein (TIGR03067 family)